MKILLVQTGFLGDVVLSTPVIANLKHDYQDAEIWALTTPEAKPLLDWHPQIFNVICFDKRGADSGWTGFWQMAARLRKENFSMAISLHKSLRTAALLLAAGIKERYGFSEAAGRLFYTRTARRSGYGHEVLRNLAVLETLGFKLDQLDTTLCIGIPEDANLRARELLAGLGKFVGIAPGSVWATKRWTPAGFARVTEELFSLGYRIILLGGPNDIEAANQVEKLSGVPVLNVVGKTSLIESVAIIKHLHLVVTNDSAPLHIAAACKTPVVALFCATVPEFGFAPWQVESECVGVLGLSCRPCGRHGGKFCPTGTNACQLQLKADVVTEVVKKILQRTADIVRANG